MPISLKTMDDLKINTKIQILKNLIFIEKEDSQMVHLDETFLKIVTCTKLKRHKYL